MFKSIRILVLILLFGITHITANAQYVNQSKTCFISINVANDADIRSSADMDFGWLVKGETKEIYATSPPASHMGPAVFKVTGEASASVTVTFPLSTTFARVGHPTDIITFNRTQVLYVHSAASVSDPTASDGLWGTLSNSWVGQMSKEIKFDGDPGIDSPRAFFYIGGTIQVPTTVSRGYYQGNYTVTLSAYHI